MKRAAVLVALAAGLLAGGCTVPQVEQPMAADAGRGRLLYENACVACHTTQAHWRERRVVNSWDDLLYQVNRWQNAAGQAWAEPDIRDVGAYLNQEFYRLPCPGKGCGSPTG